MECSWLAYHTLDHSIPVDLLVVSPCGIVKRPILNVPRSCYCVFYPCRFLKWWALCTRTVLSKRPCWKSNEEVKFWINFPQTIAVWQSAGHLFIHRSDNTSARMAPTSGGNRFNRRVATTPKKKDDSENWAGPKEPPKCPNKFRSIQWPQSN